MKRLSDFLDNYNDLIQTTYTGEGIDKKDI